MITQLHEFNPRPVPRVIKFTIPAYLYYQLSLSDLYAGAEKILKKIIYQCHTFYS